MSASPESCGVLADVAASLLADVVRHLDGAAERCADSCRADGMCAVHGDTLADARRLCVRAELVLAHYPRLVRATGAIPREQ